MSDRWAQLMGRGMGMPDGTGTSGVTSAVPAPLVQTGDGND